MAATSLLITAANLPNFLIPGVRGIMADYPYYMNEWKQIYTILPSVKNVEVDIETVPLSGGGRFGEGQNMPLGSTKQIFTTYSKMFQYGLGFVMTAISIEDNLYPDQFPKGMLGIKENLNIISEYQGIALFDNAFANTDPEFTLADGQPMCSAVHPTTGQPVSNTLTPTQLQETSAEDLIKTIQYFRDSASLPRKILPRTYLVGIENQFTVEILTGSAYRPFDTTNAVNPLTYGEYIQGGFILSHYMANPTNFFILTNYREGLVHYSRKSLEIQMTTDQANRNLGVYGSMRYRFNTINFRAVAGVQSF